MLYVYMKQLVLVVAICDYFCSERRTAVCLAGSCVAVCSCLFPGLALLSVGEENASIDFSFVC